MRRTCFVVALLCLALAAYGSLVPLRFSPVPLADAIEQFRNVRFIPLDRASRTDLVTNVLLLMPFGFFAAGALVAAARPLARLAIVPLITVIAVVAASAIELSQVYAQGRTPSWNDVFGQMVGATVGAVFWAATGPRVFSLAHGVVGGATVQDRLTRLLLLYAGAWSLLGVLPLDFTIRPAELARKFRAGRILLAPPEGAGPLALVTDLGSTALYAAPLGVLGVLLARRYRWSSAAGLAFGLAMAASLEVIQVFVYSRYAVLLDAVAGAAGAGLGASGALAYLPKAPHAQLLPSPAGARPGWRLWPVIALVLWCGVLALRHWAPFEFVLTREMFDARWPRLWRVPFSGYYWAMPLDALSEAMRKILMAVPVGVLPLVAWPRGVRDRAWPRLLLVGMIAVIIFGAIELGQVFLPKRFPDNTDVLLGLLGSMAGAVLWFLVLGRAETRRSDVRGHPEGSGRRPDRTVGRV